MQCQWLSDDGWTGCTHIGVPPDLLDDILIEVTRVSEQGAGNVVGVLQASEALLNQRLLRPLLELGLAALGRQVDALHPVVVGGGQVLGDVRLELDHVGVGDVLAIARGDDRRGLTVGDAVEQHWRCRGRSRQREANDALHDGGTSVGGRR